MFKEKIKKIKEGLGIKREDISIVVFSIVITTIFFACYYFWGNYLITTIGIINITLLGVIALIFMALAGFMVLKSLFLIAAELSLLIFLSQSYCAVAIRSDSSNEALKSLLVIGAVYIIASFFHSLYKSIKDYKNKEGKSFVKEVGLGVVILFGFIGLFIWQVYLVVYPIITDLCIYK
ncbi:MAG: hypothetical protein WCX30_01660 [Candidatus Paceibacterota bacterium]|jgi:hypothetical protein|nr:hypothetical protein [bacterium]